MKSRLGLRFLLVLGLLLFGLSQTTLPVAAADTSQETAIKRAVVKKGKFSDNGP